MRLTRFERSSAASRASDERFHAMQMTAVILLVLKASIILSVFAIGLKATFADATSCFAGPVTSFGRYCR